MANCININSAQYRELKRLSKLPEILLKAEVARYQNSHNGRFPKIDELPGADSSEAMIEDLKIRKDGTSKIQNILESTNTKSLDEALIVINDKYRDLDTEILPLKKTALFNIKRRPSVFEYIENPKGDFKYIDSKIFLVDSLNKMSQTMGINIKHLSVLGMRQLGILEQIPDAAQAAAFIFNGDIYINTDIASIDAKIHELLHIFLGSMKFKEPNLYMSLVESVLNLPNIEELAQNYPNRTQSDTLEEIFVSEFSKYLAGMPNLMSELDQDLIYQVTYNINRTLDTMLMGDNSTSAIAEPELYNSSLRTIGELVNSSTMNNITHGFLEDALIHRTLANVKQELLENGDLKEEC